MKNAAVLLTFLALILSASFARAQKELTRQTPHVAVLSDGSVIPCAVSGLTQNAIQIQRLSAPEEISIPLQWVSGIVFSRPVSAPEEQRLIYSILSGNNVTDELISCANKKTSGAFMALSDYSLVWKNGVEVQNIPLNQIRALLFASGLRKKTEAKLHTIALNDGAIIRSESFQVSGNSVTIHVPWNTEQYVFPQSEIALSFPEFTGDWLDEIPVTQYKFIPYWSLSRRYGVNCQPDGAWLKSNSDTIYLRGFYVYCSSRLTFSVKKDKKYNKLTGIIARPGGVKQGAARFRIFADGVLAGSWTLSASDFPQEISVELNSPRRLDLVVDFADDSPVDGSAIWGNVFIHSSDT